MTANRAKVCRYRGAVAVELTFALCFVLMPMLLGIWEIGCLLDAQQTLVEAVREGGRQASTGNMTNSQVQAVVLNYLTVAKVNTANVVVTVSNTGTGTDVSLAAQLDPLTVSAKLPFKNVDWSFTQQYVSDSSFINTSVRFYSMRDTPITSTPVAPAQ